MSKKTLGVIMCLFLGFIGLLGLLACDTKEEKDEFMSGWLGAFFMLFIAGIVLCIFSMLAMSSAVYY